MPIQLYTSSKWISAGQEATIEIPNVGDYQSYQIDLGDGNIISFNTSLSSVQTAYAVPTGLDVGPGRGAVISDVLSSNNLKYYAEGIELVVAPDISVDPSTIAAVTTSVGSLTSIRVSYPNGGTKTVKVSASTGTDITSSTETQDFVDFHHVAQFETFNPDIFRIYLVTPLKLPWSCPKLPPNEWITDDNINAVFTKFYENQIYLENASHMYDAPPTNYVGWFGTTAMAIPYWHNYVENLSANYLNLSGAITFDTFTNIKDIKFYSETLWLAADKQITARALDFTGTLVAQITAKSLLDTFGSIAAIDLDSKSNLYVADGLYNEISVFSTSRPNPDSDQPDVVTVNYLYKWGGADTFLPKAKFVGLNDIHVDIDDNIFVVDIRGSCIKKFSPTGTWLLTIRHPDIQGTTVTDGGPISVTTDQYKNIHVLTYFNVYMFSPEGVFIKSYSNRNTANQTPKKITTNWNKNGFIYIVFANTVLKFTEDGLFAGKVTENIEASAPKEFTGASQDENYNLYISANPAIYKYVDLVKIVNVKSDTSSIEWPLSAITIDREEFIQDWVYNRSFARLWDNMEIFRRAIYDKFRDREVQPGVSALYTEFFTLSDELYFPYGKDDIVIGMNEFVTFEVVNRVIEKLCANQEVLRLMLLERPLLPGPLQGMFYWCWKALRCSGVNPVIWTDLIAPGFKPSRWREARSTPCCPGQVLQIHHPPTPPQPLPPGGLGDGGGQLPSGD